MLWNEGEKVAYLSGGTTTLTPDGRPGEDTPMVTIVRTQAEAQPSEPEVATALDELARERAPSRGTTGSTIREARGKDHRLITLIHNS